jgi:hypothetical protein
LHIPPKERYFSIIHEYYTMMANSMKHLYRLPKVFSYSPLTLTLSPQRGERVIKEGTFGNCYKLRLRGAARALLSLGDPGMA